MRLLKPFLTAFGLVAVLDVLWSLVNTYLLPVFWLDATTWQGPWAVFVIFDPTVVLPCVAIGLLVAVAGWIRVRALVPGLMVALGALVGTVVPLALLFFFLFTGPCQCEGG